MMHIRYFYQIATIYLSFVKSSLKATVWLFIRGFAQKAIQRIYSRSKKLKHMANCSPTISFKIPMIKGEMAPPITPVHRIPAIAP